MFYTSCGVYFGSSVYHAPQENIPTTASLLPIATGFAFAIGIYRLSVLYIWGGYNPNTSFDCSGYVSWVINNSGWNVGRLGAQGLYNICTPVSAANAKPGDLVFFVGTYNTPGVSHVGIYVGDGMMVHAGNPIGYVTINTAYWQSHFYAYGRLP